MSRLRYSLLSPRAPRQYAGYLAGLLLAVLGVVAFVTLGVVAPILTHAAVFAIVTVTA